MLIDWIAVPFLFAGAFFLLSGSLGLIRLGDTLSRLHALTKADMLGFGFITLGLTLSADSLSEALKLILIWVLIIAYSSLVGYALAHKKRKADNV